MFQSFLSLNRDDILKSIRWGERLEVASDDYQSELAVNSKGQWLYFSPKWMPFQKRESIQWNFKSLQALAEKCKDTKDVDG